MKHILAILATFALASLGVTAAAYAADAKPIDPEFARLQAAEAAVRAGATRAPSAVIRNAPPPRTNESSDAAPTRGKSADGFFPLPPRADARPRGGVDALVAAHGVTPSVKTTPRLPTPDDAATAEGLAAIDAARRERGANC